MSALCAWLVRQCDEFVSPTSGNVVVQTVPSPVTLCPVLLGRHQPFLSVPQRPLLVHRNQANPFTVAAPPAGPSEPANPFSAAAPTVPQVPREAIVASNPFVALHPGSLSSTPALGSVQTVSCSLLWMIHMFQIHVWLEVVHRTFQFPLLLRPPASVLSFDLCHGNQSSSS